MEHKAYHINTSTLVKTDISRYIIDQSPVIDYSRNDDFSPVFMPITGKIVQECPEAYRTTGEYWCFQVDSVVIWYGILQEPKLNELTLCYSFELIHCVNNLKEIDVADITDYDKVDAGFVTDVDASAYGQGTLKIVQVKGAVKLLGESVLPSVIDTVTFDFTAGDLSTFEGFKYFYKQMWEYALTNNKTAFDFLVDVCRAFGLVVKIRDNAIVFKKFVSSTSTATYKTATYNAYPVVAHNKVPDYNKRNKQANKTISVSNDGYYQDIMSYIAYPGTSPWSTVGNVGYITAPVASITGYSNSNGFREWMRVISSEEHGLDDELYRKVRLKNLLTYGLNQNFNNKIDNEYAWGSWLDGGFYAYDSTGIFIYSSVENFPRLEVTRDRLDVLDYSNVWQSSDIFIDFTSVGGKAQGVLSTSLLYRPTTDFGITYGCTIVVSSGAYAGTYYGDSDEPDSFSIVDAIRIKLSANWSVDEKVKAEITWRPIIKAAEEASGRVLLTFFEATPWMTNTEPYDITLVNCDRENNSTITYTYDGIYTNDPTETDRPTWNTTDYTTLRLYSIQTSWQLSDLNIQTLFDEVVPGEPSKNHTRISFPKHFIFFSSLLTTAGNLFRMYGVYPLGVGNTLYHLTKAATESYTMQDEEINIDDTETLADVCHKEVKYRTSLKERSIDIKQQELL